MRFLSIDLIHHFSFLLTDSVDVDPEIVRLNSVGFTGCLSVVQFNSVSPLKAALLYPDKSPVIVTGSLTESSCGSSLPSNPYAAETTHSLTGKAKTNTNSDVKKMEK